jgi:hypothetical protein
MTINLAALELLPELEPISAVSDDLHAPASCGPDSCTACRAHSDVTG